MRIFKSVINRLFLYFSIFFLFLKINRLYFFNFRRGLITPKLNDYVISKFPELFRIYSVDKSLDDFIHLELEVAGDYSQIFPDIPNINMPSFNVSVGLPSRVVYLFDNVEVRPNNSFVYKDNSVFIPKQKHKTNKIKAEVSENKISLNEQQLIEISLTDYNKIYCQNVISLMGHYSDHFGHFLLEYIERLDHINKLGIDPRYLSVLISENCDENIRDLVLEVQRFLGFDIKYIKNNTKVFCEKYYHIDPFSVVCDGANYASITDKLYYASFNSYFKQKQATPLLGKGRKLYLARRGRRTLLNFREVEAYFLKSGYEIIDNCHEMSVSEKMILFGNASFIAGPAGSAFFNCIWCPRDVKILNFINYEIAYDNCLQNMLSQESKIYFLAGKEINYKFYNSDYHIDLEEIMYHAKKLGFTS